MKTRLRSVRSTTIGSRHGARASALRFESTTANLYPADNKTNSGILAGSPLPLGASQLADGSVNFALQSQHASAVSIVFFDSENETEPLLEVALSPISNRTGDIWHIRLRDLPSATHTLCYAYRCEGEGRGSRCDPSALVADPYAAAVHFPRGETCMLGLVPQPAAPAGAAAARPALRREDLVLYHLHPEAFARLAPGPAPPPGASVLTAVLHKLDYLVSLGVTAVVLDPIAAHVGAGGAARAASWVAPHPGFAGSAAAAPGEVRALAEALHARGIELLAALDFSETAEGTDAHPRPLSMRGVDAASYYRLQEGPEGAVVEAGGGASGVVDCCSPALQDLALAALRHWVTHYRVDGFYVKGAQVLGLGRAGEAAKQAPLLEAIALDPVLHSAKLVADTSAETPLPHWGAWAQLNPLFGADVARFLAGQEHAAGALAARLCGSGELLAPARGPTFGVNTLGPSRGPGPAPPLPASTPALLTAAPRQVRNRLVALLVSGGVPMLRMGEEWGAAGAGPEQAGAAGEQAAALIRFTQHLVRLRKRHAHLFQHYPAQEEVEFHGRVAHQAEWEDGNSRVLAMTLQGDAAEGQGGIYVAFNAHAGPVEFQLPCPPAGTSWYRIVDSGRCEETNEELLPGSSYTLEAHSALVLEGRTADQQWDNLAAPQYSQDGQPATPLAESPTQPIVDEAVNVENLTAAQRMTLGIHEDQ